MFDYLKIRYVQSKHHKRQTLRERRWCDDNYINHRAMAQVFGHDYGCGGCWHDCTLIICYLTCFK